MFKKLFHHLFKCPSFWKIRSSFTCPDCGKEYRCYWDGYDCPCGTIHLCKTCATTTHAEHRDRQKEGNGFMIKHIRDVRMEEIADVLNGCPRWNLRIILWVWPPMKKLVDIVATEIREIQNDIL